MDRQCHQKEGRALMTLVIVMACLALLAISATSSSARCSPPVNHSWAGTSTYYLWACNATTRNTFLKAMQMADLKVLRIFILNSCTSYSPSCLGYNPCSPVPDVEDPVGVWHDDILNRIDDLMADAYRYGIKLTIALHDRWSLGCWRRDAYVKKYDLQVTDSCSDDAEGNEPGPFYRRSDAQADFKRRISHILEHRNPHFNNRPWKNLTEVVFSYQPENEPRYGSNPDWLAMMTAEIKRLAPHIPVSTGGASGGLPAPPPSQLAAIQSVDIITLHDYSKDIPAQLQSFRAAARQYGKRYLLEEFGFGYGPDQRSNYQAAIGYAMAQPYMAPWFFWALGPDDTNPGSLDIFPGNAAFDSVVLPQSHLATRSESEQCWPEIW